MATTDLHAPASPRRRAVTVGSATVDIITVVADRDIERVTMANATTSFLLLEQGRKIEAESISIHPGGGAINGGVCLARLGYEVAPLVKLGDDLNAAKVLETFEAERLSTALVTRTRELGTGTAVMIASHDRNATIFTLRGANTAITPADVPADAFASVAVVHVGGLSNQSAECFALIVRRAREAGAFVSSNPGIRQLTARREAFLAALGDVDLLNINRVEAEALMPAFALVTAPAAAAPAGSDLPPLARRGLVGLGFDMGLAEFMAAVHARGPRYVALTDGTGGAYLSAGGRLHHCPAVPVEAAGTAGAGDAFAATLAAMLADDRAPGDSLRAATLNAASVVRHVDTQTGLLSARDLSDSLAGSPGRPRARLLA